MLNKKMFILFIIYHTYICIYFKYLRTSLEKVGFVQSGANACDARAAAMRKMEFHFFPFN